MNFNFVYILDITFFIYSTQKPLKFLFLCAGIGDAKLFISYMCRYLNRNFNVNLLKIVKEKPSK